MWRSSGDAGQAKGKSMNAAVNRQENKKSANQQRAFLPFAFCLLTVALFSSACRQDMHDNPRFEPYEDGANRELPGGTVARGSLQADPGLPQPQRSPNAPLVYVNGEGGRVPIPSGEDGFPFSLKDAAGKVDRAKMQSILDRGQSRFQISCRPCHGELGDGNGMVAMRGFRKPPSYHEERLIKAPASHFYDVMTNGYGAMSSYSDQLTPEDRWKVAAYIRVLQASQNVRPGEMPEADRAKFEASMAATANKSAHGSQNGEHGTDPGGVEHRGKTEERAPAQGVAPQPGTPSGPVEPEKTGGHN